MKLFFYGASCSPRQEAQTNSIIKTAFYTALFSALLFSARLHAQTRTVISLNSNWTSIASDSSLKDVPGFEQPGFAEKGWVRVQVPHNWDQYEGYRRMKHGNRHGTAWYRKSFSLSKKEAGKSYFLFFEGVGSYATVYLNGTLVGYHAGGRTTFTLDVTDAIQAGKPNLLAVEAGHPAYIQDLPWVCGGCSDEVGFSEGSQPMGIFRPVSLMVTNPLRIAPFGIWVRNKEGVSAEKATLLVQAEVTNYSTTTKKFTIDNILIDASGKTVATVTAEKLVKADSTLTIDQQLPELLKPHLWSPASPYLYKLVTKIKEAGKLVDEETTDYGIRWLSWPQGRKDGSKDFRINGKSFFINGTAEYEHLMGRSHAFTDQQVKARVGQILSGGYNAFRDAHQPHNLRYQHYWDSVGYLWWPQFAAHIWYNTPEFKSNFKNLLRDWIKERRNSPSIILWGLENESKLPKEFAEECTKIIREMDPGASVERPVTTCNGGEGSDWDVPQNWTGTYGGDPSKYGEELKKQLLVGEYGAWRTLGLHSEGGFVQNGAYSEDRMTLLLEEKIRLAEAVKDSTCGHFHWLMFSHENPGRAQSGEVIRGVDKIGPVNYKGLFTAWGEPVDAYYMFRANFAPKDKEPMVYITSHTWPDRWMTPGKRDSLFIYSNCDEVELFNGDEQHSLGKKKSPGFGRHYQWDGVMIQYNKLFAHGFVNGKMVARDSVLLHHLPPISGVPDKTPANLLSYNESYNYIYRVNCGGPDFIDDNNNLWMADCHLTEKNAWGSNSWSDDFPGMPPFFGSQRVINGGGRLFQSYRFGMDRLKYTFPVPDGDYLVDLYFLEPWYGVGGGMNCTGWRIFDVAVNGSVMIKGLDIWKEAGTSNILRKTLNVHVAGGKLEINFPNVVAGEAVISAIAIATKAGKPVPAGCAPALIRNLVSSGAASDWQVRTWLNTGDRQYSDNKNVMFGILPSALYATTWVRMPHPESGKERGSVSFTVSEDADVYIGIDTTIAAKPVWMKDWSKTNTAVENNDSIHHHFVIYKQGYKKNEVVHAGTEACVGFMAASAASTIDPAYDQKTTASYKADKAVYTKGVVKDSLLERQCLSFTRQATDTLGWTISIGVADKYALRYKYVNASGAPITARILVIAADGSLMNEETVEFRPYLPGKYGILHTNTGTSINAGNYRVLLVVDKGAKLSISGLEVQ